MTELKSHFAPVGLTARQSGSGVTDTMSATVMGSPLVRRNPGAAAILCAMRIVRNSVTHVTAIHSVLATNTFQLVVVSLITAVGTAGA